MKLAVKVHKSNTGRRDYVMHIAMAEQKTEIWQISYQKSEWKILPNVSKKVYAIF